MEFCDPYDISKHLTEDFYNNLHSAKWSERRDAIQSFINIAEKNPLFSPKESELHTLIDELSKTFTADSNINVAACAAQAFVKIAQGATGIFKNSAPSIILIALQRSKEVKPVMKNACSECLDASYSTTTFANVIESIKEGLALKAPGSKIQACEFFTRIMLKIDFPTAKKSASATKEIVDLLCKLALGSDPACRDASMRALAAFMRAVTKQIAAPLLSTVAEDKLKMAKVDEYYDQFVVDHPFDDGKKKAVETPASAPTASAQSTSSTAPVQNVSSEPAAVDSRLFATPYDLTKHLTDEFYTNLHSAKWSERRDAIQDLITIAEKNPVFANNDSGLHTLIDELSKTFTADSNINVAACAALMFSKLAYGSVEVYRNNAPSIILICLQRSKEVKPVLKNACAECLDSSYSATTFANVIGPIKEGLALTAPGSKIQACEFFTRIMLKIDFPTAKKSSAATKEIVDQLCKLALGSDVACREAAMRSLAAFMRAVSKKIAQPLLGAVANDKLKMAKVDENYEQFIAEYPFDDGTPKQAARPTTAQKPAEQPIETLPKVEPVAEPNAPAQPQIVETPLVRAMNQATSEAFQQMHRIVSDDLASMPLESLLNLNHVMPRRLGTLQTGEIGEDLIGEEDLLNVDPKTAINEALNNLNSSQMSLANSAVVALMALVQDSFNQKALAAKSNSIFFGVIGKFKEVAELYQSQNAHTMETKDCEEYLRQASNFLLKFIPQPAIANGIDAELFELLTSSLLSLLPSFEENNTQRRNIQALFNCMSENFPINIVLLSSIKLVEKFVKICVPEEIENPSEEYRKTLDGCKLHQLLLVISRALESCEQKKERYNEVDVFAVQSAFSKATHLILNPMPNAPAKGAIKSSICYVLQKFVKANMIQALITAVRLDENTKYADYTLKTHQAFLLRELSTQGEDKIEGMLCGYTHRLLKRFGDHDFTFALESLYGVYKHCAISSRFKPLQAVFNKTIKSSAFAPVIEEALHKMNETYMAGDELDIEDYLFSTFMTGSALELYRTTQKLCKLILSKPNVQELDELQFESDFLNQLRQMGGGPNGNNHRLEDFAEPLSTHDPNKTLTIHKTPERTRMNDDETLNLFKTVVKPRRSGVPSVKIPSQMHETLQRHLNGNN